MSLSLTLPSERTIISTPAVTTTLPVEVTIERIIDIPAQKQVLVFVQGLGRILLEDLSGDNYDQPAEWSNSDVVVALKNYIDRL